MKNIALCFLLLFINGFSIPAKAKTLEAPQMSKANAYQFSFTGSNGQEIALADFQGKVLLIVNTASHCGLTPQYKELQILSEKYKEKGLVVLGVPSSDFGDQEFETEKEVEDFTVTNYAISFPLTAINNVKGKNAHPFYLWANKQAGMLGGPKWNFHKYLIDQNGDFSAWFSSTTSPTSKSVTTKIDALFSEGNMQ